MRNPAASVLLLPVSLVGVCWAVVCNDVWTNCTASMCKSARDYPETPQMAKNCALTCGVCTYNLLVKTAKTARVIPHRDSQASTLPVDGRTFPEPQPWDECFKFDDNDRNTTQMFCVELMRTTEINEIVLYMTEGEKHSDYEVTIGTGKCQDVTDIRSSTEQTCGSLRQFRGLTAFRLICAQPFQGTYVVVRSQHLRLCEVVIFDLTEARCSLGYYESSRDLCKPCKDLCKVRPGKVVCDYLGEHKSVCADYPPCQTTDEAGHLGLASGIICHQPCDVDRCVLPGTNSAVCDRWSGACLSVCSVHHYGMDCERTCWRCLQECDRLGSCFSGGVCGNSSFGRECQKACSCKGGCSRWDGICWEKSCAIGTYGDLCERNCTQCKKGCDRNHGFCLLGGCVDNSYWGPWCTYECFGCATGCFPHNGKCLAGCKTGFYDPYCAKTCNSCRGGCNSKGLCSSGCKHGHYGKYCELPCPFCAVACEQSAGRCIGACKKGFYGSHCFAMCFCMGEACDKVTGLCKAQKAKLKDSALRIDPPYSEDHDVIAVFGMVVAFTLALVWGNVVYYRYRRYRVVTFPIPDDTEMDVALDPLPSTDPDAYYNEDSHLAPEGGRRMTAVRLRHM